MFLLNMSKLYWPLWFDKKRTNMPSNVPSVHIIINAHALDWRALVSVSVYFCYTSTCRDAHSYYVVLWEFPIPGTEYILSMVTCMQQHLYVRMHVHKYVNVHSTILCCMYAYRYVVTIQQKWIVMLLCAR